MMKNKSTLAKLLAEEDIFVVHKQTPTAYFDVKRRELGLPIWKDEEMTDNIYDLMVCHEIAHALWTPLTMMEEVISRKLNKSVVNILEDARIEKMVQKKYPGSVGVFNRGYAELGEKNFFDVEGEDISKLTLIDRINLFFKKQKGVTFSDEEKVFVKKTNELETTEDVLVLAEEILKWMEENPTEEEKSTSEDGEGESDVGDDNGETETVEGEKEDGDDDTDDGLSDASGLDEDDDKTDGGESEVNSDIGGTQSSGHGGPPIKTDTDSNNAIDKLRDADAIDRTYGRIAPIPKDTIITYKTCLDELGSYYAEKSKVLNAYFTSTRDEVMELKSASKKTVAYMVKEFEMKKSADQYARAAVAKTGTLDMGALHTYKFNDDLFKKVTTLPGATNHGMVMVLDWSGSMYENLVGTLSQLYNLVWFCRRTQIPFKVFAFSDHYKRVGWHREQPTPVEYGEIEYQKFNLLEFFSSDMSGDEENRMMHYLWMIANRWVYRDYDTKGFPIEPSKDYTLGGTPLDDTILAMTHILPKFKMDTGVQKVNTIFLTDGASNRNTLIRDYDMVNERDVMLPLRSRDHETIITNPKNNKTYSMGKGWKGDVTNELLRILKDSVDGMNLIGFFIAGSGKTGRIDKRTIAHELGISYYDDEMKDILKKVNKEKYLAVAGDTTGYDEYYLLQGGRNLEVENDSLDDELVGASKAKLKSAFGKMSKGKVQSRTLLNRFVKLVA
tara:strand:- start:519 stop:2696 length:2178 start_codon:yes stop_codon:yes gene_type:complete